MKILMAIRVSRNRTGGPARQMHYLKEELSKLGHQVDLVFEEDVPNPFRWAGLESIAFPILLPWTLCRLHRIHGPYDLVTIHALEGAAYVWLRKVFKGMPPCVIVSHGGDELRWELEREEAMHGLLRLSWRARWLYGPLVISQAKYATRHADRVITMASSEKEFYIRRYGIPPEKISVVPNGVEEIFFQARDYARRPEKLLYLGGWEWRKGIRYLKEAFVRLAGSFEWLTLSVAGTKAAEGILEEFPSRLRSRIRIVPLVEPEDLPQVYAAHDLFILPTLFESIPLVLPEAMASGMPIVTTRVCGIPDILQDGVNAFLVSPRDSVSLATRVGELIRDGELRRRLGIAAQQKARELTWDRIAQQTARTYEEVLKRK